MQTRQQLLQHWGHKLRALLPAVRATPVTS